MAKLNKPKVTKIVEQEMWDHYSELPNPAWYEYKQTIKTNKMEESKELLEATVKGLQDQIQDLNSDLDKKRQELADINKPEITGETYDALESCVVEGIQEALGNLSVDDIEVEYGLDYDSKIYLESFDIPEDGLADYILGEINNKFKVK